MAEETNNVMTEQPGKNHFFIVGIGASAGGTEALQLFFEHVPENSGMAYVVILHLSPQYESQLAEILQRETSMPVMQVTERVKIEPNHVYVVSPNQHLLMEYGYITVSPNISTEDRRAPIDIFFRSLAEVYQAYAVGIILSGTGANGSMGIKRIKEQGGAAFVQNPREALYNEMPRNAIATDLIDSILPVADIPKELVAYKNNLGTVQIPVESSSRPEDQQLALRDIFTQLRLRTGHDFSNYKRATLLRRIERRVNVHHLPSLTEYAAYLQQHPEEAQALLKDLLISVTNFFRDPKAFAAIEQDVLPRILQEKHANNAIRIWVVGCATGEEAYSLAMLCAEKTIGSIDAPKVQIFATDIDETAIATAREGLYSINDAADVSPERLRRFFTKEGDSYRIRREIREMVLFAHHNVLKDPPFSRLDLVSCRNMLIYLNNVAQERVMETIHFALHPGGYLFLGSSESANSAGDLFLTVNRDSHIFQSRPVAARPYPVPESTPTFHYERKQEHPSETESNNRVNNRISYTELHQQLLEQYAPPSVVVNEEYDIVHLTERVGKYLQIGGGEVSKNLLKLIRPELRLELRSAFYQAAQRRTNVEVSGLKVKTDHTTETINIHVRPVLREGDMARGFILVLFEPATGEQTTEERVTINDEPVARQLEDELMRMKTQLRTTIEQHEVQAEELKASNEELQAMNEELRSAAEELETSKEELQSINEELTTVNQELKVKIEEITLANNNFQNLINSTDIATIFLDRSLRINMYTPPAREIFNVIPADFGRPISDITNKLTYAHLLEDAEQVLEKLQTVEREVRTTNDHIYLMRVLPYRTEEDRINGVVITFINITERRRAEEALHASEEKYRTQLELDVATRTAELQESREQYASLVENTPDVITRWNKDLKLVFANSAFNSKTGISLDQLYGKNNSEMGQPDEIALPYMNSLRKVFQTGEAVEHFNTFPTPEGEAYFYSRLVPERNDKGEVETVLAIARDITDIRKAEQEIKDSKKLLQATINSSMEMIQVFEAVRDDKGEIVDFEWILNNHTAEKIYGDVIGKSLLQNNPGVIEEGIFDTFKKVVETGIANQSERHYVHEQFDGWFFQSVVKLGDGVVTTTADITERKTAEQEILRLKDEITQRATDRYYSLFNSIDEGFCIIEMIYDEEGKAIDYRFVEVNQSFERQTGLSDVVGKTGKDVTPNDESYWMEIYNKVAERGEAVRFINYHKPTGRWYESYASRLGNAESWQVAIVFNDITQRKKAEEALRQSEERKAFLLKLSDALRPLSNAADIQKLVTHDTMVHFKADRSYYCEIKGDVVLIRQDAHREDLPTIANTYSLANMPLFKTVSEAGRPIVVPDVNTSEIMDDVLKQLCVSVGILSYINVPVIKNGELVGNFCLTQSTPRNWTDNEVDLAGEIAERTWAAVERVRAEEALRTSENRFRTLTDAVPQVIWANNAAGKAIYFNQRWFQYSGLSYEESAGPGWQAIVHPEDAPSSVEKWNEALAKGKVFDTEYRLRRADGVYRWHLGRNVPLYDEEGKVTGWFGSATDIEDLTVAEASLRESEERYRALVSQTSVGIVRTDVAGKFILMNEKTRSMFGFNASNGEKDNLSLWDLTLPEDLEDSKRLYKRLIDEGLPFQYEKKIKRLNGTAFWASVSMAPIKNNSSKISSAVGVITDITGRKQAEDALRETMERFQYAVRATRDVIWEIDFKKDRVWWSSMMQAELGYSQTEVQHSIAWYQSLVHPNDRERVVNSFKKAVESNNELWIEEFRYRQRNGNYVCVANRSFIIRDEGGKAVRMIGAMQDITERKKAESALRESEGRLRITLEAGEMATWDWHVANDKITWNEQHYKLLGVPTSQFDNVQLDYFIQFIHPDDLPEVKKQLQEVLGETGIYQCEFRVIREDNKQVRWMHGYGRATERQDGKVLRASGVMYDITERRKVEEALEAAQNSLKTAVEAAQMGVWDIDLATDTTLRSPRHDQLLGFDRFQEEWNHERVKEHMVEEDKPKFDAARKRMFETGKFELEARIRHTDKSICWVQLYGKLFRNERGEPNHAAGVIFDISDRKSAEQRKDEFIGIASHELKTPVTSIKAYTEILRDQFVEAGDEQSASFLNKLNGQVDRLTGLIRDLLDATRISEGRMVFNKKEVDINQLLHDVTEELQRTDHQHTIELDLQEFPLFKGDKERLQQVFVNLLSNAIKYSPDANKVIIKSYIDKDNIYIAVQDHGIGMSSETQSRLFERFFRSNDPSIATFPGLGLGLYISMQIVKQHKGTITVQSEKGKGSLFTVVLPVQQ